MTLKMFNRYVTFQRWTLSYW